MLFWEIHILLWVFGMLLWVTANIMKFWVISMLCYIISMLFWVISVLLLNSSELHPSALLTLNIYYQPGRSAASLQSSLPSFPKTTHVHIASNIAVDLSAKLTQNNSLPTALLTNRLLRVTAVVTMRNLCAAPSDWNAFLGVTLNSSHLHVSTFIFIIIYPINNTTEEWPANFFSALGI